MGINYRVYTKHVKSQMIYKLRILPDTSIIQFKLLSDALPDSMPSQINGEIYPYLNRRHFAIIAYPNKMDGDSLVNNMV